MFDLSKLQQGLNAIVSNLEKHQARSIRSTMATNIFCKIMDDQKSDADLVATAKVAVRMADIILVEMEKHNG